MRGSYGATAGRLESRSGGNRGSSYLSNPSPMECGGSSVESFTGSTSINQHGEDLNAFRIGQCVHSPSI